MPVNGSVPDVAEKRKNWNGLISGFRASDLVFLDESGCNTDMTRRYAYSLGGSRAVDSAPLLSQRIRRSCPRDVKDLLDSSGVRYTYLPPYSPDLNPIEKLWSKVKALLRKFKARSPDALPNAIQHAFQNVSPSDCSGWFRSCGYAL